MNLEQEKLREYYIKNKERIQEKKKQYRLNNSEKIKEKNREYNLKNKDAIKEKNREYYLQHRESLQQKKKEYRRKNKVKIKQKNQEYLIKNKESMKDKWRAYYLENKETIKERKKEYRTKKKMNENALSRKRFSWKDSASTRKYFETTATFFHITDYSDWYRVSRSQINLTGGSIHPLSPYYFSCHDSYLLGNGLIRKFGNLGNALKYAYPEIPWDLSKFSFRGKKSAQRWLFVKMKQLLPNMKIMEEFSHPDLVWGKLRTFVISLLIDYFRKCQSEARSI